MLFGFADDQRGSMANVCLIVIDGWGISDQVEGNKSLNLFIAILKSFQEMPS